MAVTKIPKLQWLNPTDLQFHSYCSYAHQSPQGPILTAPISIPSSTEAAIKDNVANCVLALFFFLLRLVLVAVRGIFRCDVQIL